MIIVGDLLCSGEYIDRLFGDDDFGLFTGVTEQHTALFGHGRVDFFGIRIILVNGWLGEYNASFVSLACDDAADGTCNLKLRVRRFAEYQVDLLRLWLGIVELGQRSAKGLLELGVQYALVA